MLTGIKLRLYPNQTQIGQLWQMFGNDRFVWNKMLDMMNERYKNNKDLPFLTKFKLNYLLKPLKKEYPFLKNSDSSSLQLVNEFLNQSWKNFFKDKTGTVGKPRFHSRRYLKPSYTGKSIVKIAGRRYLYLPKLGYIKTSKTGVLKDVKIKRYTVSLEPTGKYYLSIQAEVNAPEKLKKTGKQVGIDVGVADLAILSNGLKYPAFDASYFEKQSRIWQCKYSRRRHLAYLLCEQDKNQKVLNPRSLESFSNWQRARKLKASYQKKVANKRKDYLHKLTTHLVRQYDVIGYIRKGEECIYWSRPGIQQPDDYNAETDVGFLTDICGTAIPVREGDVVVLFPEDVHKPKCIRLDSCRVEKVVIKVRLEE